MAQAIIANSRQVFLAADHTKFGRNAMVRLGGLEDVDALFTDAAAAALAAAADRGGRGRVVRGRSAGLEDQREALRFRLRTANRSDTKTSTAWKTGSRLSARHREAGTGEQVDLLIVGGGINGAGIARDAAGPRPVGAAGREGRSRQPHLALVLQADPWRPALSRILRVPAGPRGADRARGAAARRPAHRLAADLRPAAQPRAAAGLDDPAGPAALRPSGRPQAAARARPRSTWRGTGPLGAPLQPWVKRGFTYADCWVEDSRLVVLNAMDAAERGAVIRTRTRCERARRDGDGWLAGSGRRQRPPRRQVARPRPGQRRRPLGLELPERRRWA